MFGATTASYTAQDHFTLDNLKIEADAELGYQMKVGGSRVALSAEGVSGSGPCRAWRRTRRRPSLSARKKPARRRTRRQLETSAFKSFRPLKKVIQIPGSISYLLPFTVIQRNIKLKIHVH